MALNKFMHPRNIYKNPPDFADLAKKYEEFATIVKVDVTGKVSIDFKDPHSLRVLTKCLLKSDFNIDVIIPEDRLVPTLPLRLNYILWIEDLLNAVQRTDDVWGLDIGTGACAIYPLLAATKNKWHMVATEADDESLLKAQENVQRNSLQELIRITKSPDKSLVEHLFAGGDSQTFHFSMCNPPFYSNVQELCESRSPARLPPKNGFTGSPQELITEGGELAFCRKMINESQNQKNKVLIFTTMIGHKYNLKELEQDLQAAGISHTTTEFCQGRVTRWGLAWTYQDYDLAKLAPGRDKPRKKQGPVVYLLPELPSTPYNIDNVNHKIRKHLEDLKIGYHVINKRGNCIIMDIKALINTWSNQRRKKRQMKKLEEETVKKPRLEKLRIDESILEIQNVQNNANNTEMRTTDVNSSDQVNKCTIEKNNIGEASDMVDSSTETETKNSKCLIMKEVICEKNYENKKTFRLEGIFSDPNTCAEPEPEVHALLKIIKKDKDILLEMEFLNGRGGKEGLHQIVQYIKNNWK